MYKKEIIEKYNTKVYSQDFGILKIESDEELKESFHQYESVDEYRIELFEQTEFFYKTDIYKIDSMIYIDYIYLIDHSGFYKDWSTIRFMQVLKTVCNEFSDVYVSTYDEATDNPIDRAFFMGMLFDLDEYDTCLELIEFSNDTCKALLEVAENRLKNYFWNDIYLTNESMFSELYLKQFFRKLNFENVIYNHGCLEYGKDFILITSNNFRVKEYYGVQVKAGDLSGKANTSMREIVNQIDTAFSVPFRINNQDVFMSKVIIVISGSFTNQAKERIKSELEPYKYANVMFIDRELLISY